MIPPLPLAAASLVTGAAYLNAKLGLSADIHNLRSERSFEARVHKNISLAGDTCTLYALFARGAARVPDREALWFEERVWSYAELKRDVDRFATFLTDSAGVSADAYVAVFMSNCPEMVVAILALSKVGAVAALVNVNLRGETLRHCLGVPDAKVVLSTPELAGPIADVIAEDVLHHALDFGSFADVVCSTPRVGPSDLPDRTLPAAKRSISDLCCLIYTSGTTGHPKACAIRNLMFYVTSTPHTQDIQSPTTYLPLRTYSALPLFHGTCLFTGLAQTLGGSGAEPAGGGTFILARKFSSSQFFPTAHASNATRILYVGELCRYLLSTPPSPHDTTHSILVANGNGLRRDIWARFKSRFNIREIREFYRSTEGVAKFDNFTSGADQWGAGRLAFSGLLRRYLEKDTLIVRVDADSGDVHRDPATGFASRCAIDEAGEVLGRVKDRRLLTEYLHNVSATNSKLLTDVFEKGDMFQRMGDLCLIDRDGWVCFSDRVGESFRWKGENVAAGEVREHVAGLPGVEDVVVFGVRLEGYDGKCGGAAITLSSGGDADSTGFMEMLYASLRKKGLPDYAVPRLVRITGEISTGVTFKQATREVEARSWDEDGSNGDELWWLDGKKYRQLDKPAWAEIAAGRARI